MRHVHLEQRAPCRGFLARRLENAPQPVAEVMLTEDETGGGFLEPIAEAHLGDALPERILDALEQALALLELGVMARLVGCARETAELQVAASGVLEALALVGL